MNIIGEPRELVTFSCKLNKGFFLGIQETSTLRIPNCINLQGSKKVLRKFYYLIHQKGHGPEETTWSPKEDVHAPQFIKKSHLKYPSNLSEIVTDQVHNALCHTAENVQEQFEEHDKEFMVLTWA